MTKLEITFRSLLSRRQLTEVSKRLIANALLQSALLIERKAKKNCPVDTGFLRASIHSRRLDWNHVQIGTTMATYAAAVEYGSKPHTPPFAPIKRWAERHGIPEAAYPVLLKIQREGTPAQPFMRPALFDSEKRIAKLLIQAMREAMRQATHP